MNEEQMIKVAKEVKNMREILPALLEHAQLQAQLTRAKFEALKECGFTEAQALDLCWRS